MFRLDQMVTSKPRTPEMDAGRFNYAKRGFILMSTDPSAEGDFRERLIPLTTAPQHVVPAVRPDSGGIPAADAVRRPVGCLDALFRWDSGSAAGVRTESGCVRRFRR